MKYNGNDFNRSTIEMTGGSTTNGSHSLPAILESSSMEDLELDDSANGASLPHSEELKMAAGKGTTTRSRKKVYLVLGAVIFLLIVIISVSVRNNNRGSSTIESPSGNSKDKNKNQDKDPDAAGVAAPRNSNTKDVFDYLTQNNISSNATILTEGSPQYLAVEWLAQKDGANLPLPLPTLEARRRDLSSVAPIRKMATTEDTTAPKKTTTPTVEERQTKEYHYEYIVRYVMAVNYFAMGGDQWENKLDFLSDRNVCFWNGFHLVGNKYNTLGMHCRNDEGQPTELLLGHMSIQGSQIPTENGLLTSLLAFQIEATRIKGTIPTELCNLRKLKSLTLFENQLSGSLPTCIGNLSSVQLLYVNNNNLTGTLPTQLAHLTALKQLVLERNHFTGDPLPTFNNLSSLVQLYADHNKFDGKLHSNVLTGHHSLKDLDLSHNHFTTHGGPLPEHLFAMRQLSNLDLSNNPLKAHIPPDLIVPKNKIKNPTMIYLSLHNTNMNGAIPRFDNLVNLQHLDISENHFDGTIHSEFGNMTALRYLFLSNNTSLSPGSIPQDFAKLTHLEELSLRETQREGHLPSFIGAKLEKLQLLDLGKNRFNHTIPTDFSKLIHLKYLLLNGNVLTGNINSVSHLNLSVLLIDGNDLEFNYDCKMKPTNLFVAADCYNVSNHFEVSCDGGCCHCCYSLKEGCSDVNFTKLANLDASLGDSFNRTIYDFTGSDNLYPTSAP